MKVFELRNKLISDYADYIRSFIRIKDPRIDQYVQKSLEEGLLWPDPLIQLNPNFEPAETIDELVNQNILHAECKKVFRLKSGPTDPGKELRLHRHQADAVKVARTGKNFVLTTGTGSGKSLAYIIPIVDHVLHNGSRRGIRAIIIYPMNALANSQYGELEKYLRHGYQNGKEPVTFARYTGQETEEEREAIRTNPPDILLTNFVMLELILTRPFDKAILRAAQGLRFLVLDELHTYRGRQGADVAMLVRRIREVCSAENLQCIGTSATLGGEGGPEEQPLQVASVASRLFGSPVEPQHIIQETLKRATSERSLSDPTFVKELTERVRDPNRHPPTSYRDFVQDPISIWIETTFGITRDPRTERLVRAKPIALSGDQGAAKLAELTQVPIQRCMEAIEEGLLGGYLCERNPVTRFPAFAFRLHQFISRGDAVYASLEDEASRYITVHCQQFVPSVRSRILLPLVFCRECGQEYYCVWSKKNDEQGLIFEQRDFNVRMADEDSDPGYIYFSTDNPWPDDVDEIIGKLPEEWLEETSNGLRVRKTYKDKLPQSMRIDKSGQSSQDGLRVHFIPHPFQFCLNCRVSYAPRQTDFSKLATLSSEGRSTATTILSLSAILNLKRESTLAKRAQKLLSFTDNRQDASLQAGHFNDFVEIGVLRSAIYKAVQSAGKNGITHEVLTQRVFDALDLPLELYAADPQVRFKALVDTHQALRDTIGYKIYRDLKRGWRVTSPNLEQCGLLEIKYVSLEEVCKAGDVWEGLHPALTAASPETRYTIAKTLLDYMRRELAIKVDYLNPEYQDRIKQQSSQRLIPPWALDEDERLDYATVVYPRSVRPNDFRGNTFLSGRSGFGQYIRRPGVLQEYGSTPSVAETEQIIRQLLDSLRVAGLVEVVDKPRDAGDVPGYQIPASSMIWHAGDGTKAFHDPIRVPHPPPSGGRTNAFFIDFYKLVAPEAKTIEAREHTAQVPSELRIEREGRFREARLPVLYCSPTMELGIDIAELNLVHLRNVPPTPANYVQRSGRAGRSGQPALVTAYCSTGSPHDQFFFRRPDNMVSGVIYPPRLDLANEDLVRSHIHAIWLAETGVNLGKSLRDILDLSGEDPTLLLLASTRDSIESQQARERARVRARRILEATGAELTNADWYSDRWLDEVLNQVTRAFDQSCERWRELYRAALTQAKQQDKIIRDASRTPADKKEAERLRREAESQLKLLTESEERSVVQSDFYSYRYFASEGFLPGYNFPRLPLSAFIPGRRHMRGMDEFLSRPRFLAISEFGPKSIIYHEGSRYIINKVILPVGEEDVLTTKAKHCPHCGYLHPIPAGDGPDLCERCGIQLDHPLTQLFRMQNVSTKRRDRINSDEEERRRQGFEIKTAFRFAESGGNILSRVATVQQNNNKLGKLTYGHAATIWRVNLGWTRRRNKEQYGFVLDLERGYWAKEADIIDDEDDVSDPIGGKTRRVIPYVEDRRNCLIFEPDKAMTMEQMASLQAALKSAIQIHYQLEDSELAAEPLPTKNERLAILFFEAGEGGAGVLRHLVDDSQAFGKVAKKALYICHFDPQTFEDMSHGPRTTEKCEAACYDCLMSYGNQTDHKLLDRYTIKEFLTLSTQSQVQSSPRSAARPDHLAMLMKRADTELEKRWLRFLESHSLRLPSRAQVLVNECQTRPDFSYDDYQVAIYIDGPHHEYPERRQRDLAQTECMENHGYTVIRFGKEDEWEATLSKYPHIFGKKP